MIASTETGCCVAVPEAASSTFSVVGLITVTLTTVIPGIGARTVVPSTKFVFNPVTLNVPVLPTLNVAGLIPERTGSLEGSKALNPPRMIKIAISLLSPCPLGSIRWRSSLK